MSPVLMVQIAVTLLEIVKLIIGRANAEALLSLDGARRANIVADAVEYVKFGFGATEPKVEDTGSDEDSADPEAPLGPESP